MYSCHSYILLHSSMMVTYLLVLGLLPLALGGYLPPSDPYGNQTPMCGCNDEAMSTLAAKVESLEANLDMFRERSSVLERKFHYLERKRRQAPGADIVAFTAYLSHYEYNMAVGETVVYDTTLLNQGGAYDPKSGKFTAPVDGIYMFSFVIESKHQVDVAAKLVVDGVNQLDAVVEPEHHEQNLQGGNFGILRVNEGQGVWVSIYNSGHQSLEGGPTYRFTTFSGALLQPIVNSIVG